MNLTAALRAGSLPNRVPGTPTVMWTSFRLFRYVGTLHGQKNKTKQKASLLGLIVQELRESTGHGLYLASVAQKIYLQLTFLLTPAKIRKPHTMYLIFDDVRIWGQ